MEGEDGDGEYRPLFQEVFNSRGVRENEGRNWRK